MTLTKMSKLWVYSGDRPSNGAKALSEEVGFKRCRTGKFVKTQDQVINWGCTDLPIFVDCKHIQPPLAVKVAANKLKTFEVLEDHGISIVPWTTDVDVAAEWQKAGSYCVARYKLTGHSGDGILIFSKDSTSPKDQKLAPLYTKYVWKVKEWRVHVVNGKVIDTQQKIKDPDREVQDWKVRSHANGFIFARNNIGANPARDELAIAAVTALGLDFGAVDIVEDKNGKLFVLEVNTAPGLEGQTVTRYAEAFRGYQS